MHTHCLHFSPTFSEPTLTELVLPCNSTTMVVNQEYQWSMLPSSVVISQCSAYLNPSSIWYSRSLLPCEILSSLSLLFARVILCHSLLLFSVTHWYFFIFQRSEHCSSPNSVFWTFFFLSHFVWFYSGSRFEYHPQWWCCQQQSRVLKAQDLELDYLAWNLPSPLTSPLNMGKWLDFSVHLFPHL